MSLAMIGCGANAGNAVDGDTGAEAESLEETDASLEADTQDETEASDAEYDADAVVDTETIQTSRLEPWRPQFHFSPLTGWMNDPNGLAYFKGEYHLFYQYAPEGFLLSGMHWGHAVSADLVHWTDLPVALYPDDELGNVYSGSAVVDVHNTSGLCRGTGDDACMAALFTHSGGSSGGQKQSLAFSLDQGRTWTMHPDNPVLPPDADQKDFRDPKVLWFEEGAQWIMALTAGDRIRFYGSPDLKTWTFRGEFLKDADDETGVWECPDLFPLTVEGRTDVTKWVLVVSVFTGGPQGGSGVRYFVGDFDGDVFIPEAGADPATPVWMDHGGDFYAWQSWSDAPGGRRVGIAWLNNWRYALSLGTDPWQGAMTLPRILTLRVDATGGFGGYRLTQDTVPDLETLKRGDTIPVLDRTVNDETILMEGTFGDGLELAVTIDLGDATGAAVWLEDIDGDRVYVGYDNDLKSLYVERSVPADLAAPSAFAGRHRAPLELTSGRLDLRIRIDRSSVEIDADGGRLVMTDLIFPAAGVWRFGGAAAGGAITVDAVITGLSSIWRR